MTKKEVNIKILQIEIENDKAELAKLKKHPLWNRKYIMMHEEKIEFLENLIKMLDKSSAM